jgi:hypothetical protein
MSPSKGNSRTVDIATEIGEVGLQTLLADRSNRNYLG